MKLFWTYLRTKWRVIAAFFLFACIYAAVLVLYDLPPAAALYPGLLCLLLGIIFLFTGFFREKKRHDTLRCIDSMEALLPEELPEAMTVAEEDYRRLLSLLRDEAAHRQTQEAERFSDLTDYYTAWAHQIKTPIAAMQLNLQSEDTPQTRRLLQDLRRIEQYVEMVLTFLRLGSDSTDYVFKTYDLDSIVRPAVKKFAGEFIGKKLTLHYEPLSASVVTDEKWLAFVIGQIISNAVKYTDSGGVSVYMESPKVLCIADTGIGIAPEDLPRIFENGYTGWSGRMDKRASGIGLYLCKQICNRLGHGLSAASELGHGTVMRIDLSQNSITME